jgi:transposase InsO family protein
VEARTIPPPPAKSANKTTMHENSADSWKFLADDSRRARGFAQQAPRREAELVTRNRAANLGDELIAGGSRALQAAQRMRVPLRTLSRWRLRCRQPHPALPRGRPRMESTPTERYAVLELLDKEGEHLGLPTLRSQFPVISRGELRDLQAGYRQHYRATHRRSIERLAWQESGTVWATDHVAPPGPIDGVDRAVLAVRDLASGMELAWDPVPDQSTPPATAALESLFVEHGPPLVLKSDNGSAFKSGEFQSMLAAYNVTWLPSPPRTPRYNGGCEAGNGSLRCRTNHFARHAGRWTSASMAVACQQANELTRPWGHRGPTHRDRWSARQPIAPQRREAFVAAVERHRQAILAERKITFNPENKNHQHQVQRQAVRRALLELGLLTTTRRSITLPIKRKKQAIFS